MSDLFEVADAPIVDGVSLVEASAGTGKTYSLVGLVLRALLEGKVESIDQVLVVTFTNAATDELTTRIRGSIARAVTAFERDEDPDDELLRVLLDRHGAVGVKKLRAALRDFDRIGVSTIHGFCHRVLVETAFESGMPYDVELIDDPAPLLERAAQDFWRTRLYGLDGAIAALMVEAGLTPTGLLEDYGLWRRHPGTRILPDAVPLDDLIEKLETRIEAVRSSWDRSRFEAFVKDLPFNKSSQLHEDRRRTLLDAMDAFGKGADGCIAATAELTSENLAAGQHKTKKTREDPPYEQSTIAACDALHRSRTELTHAVRCAFIADVDERLERIKRDAAALSHDDLIRRLREAIDDEGRARAVARVVGRRYRVAFIDEFQDTDHDQYAIFRRLFEGRPVYLIGDPKQAIYGFRGADVYAYLAAKQDAVATYTLRHNRRSTPGLIEAVNALFSERDHAFAEERIRFEDAVPGDDPVAAIDGDDGRPLEWMWLGEHSSESDGGRVAVAATVHEIVALLDGPARIDGRPVEPQDIAVLVGRHQEARAVREALAAAGVQAVQRRSGDIHGSDEMIELARLVAAVADPGSVGRVKAALATRLWGLGPRELREIDEDEGRWQDTVELLAEHRDRWKRRGFMRMIGALADRLEIRPRLAAYADGDRRLTNFRHAAELLHQAELEHHLSPDGLLRWLERERRRDHRGQDAVELRIEREVRSVEIVTVHSSKGLQYEIVFCPFIRAGKAPKAGKPALRHVGLAGVEMHCEPEAGSEFLASADRERLGEDIRLAYVALTRARRRCYVGVGSIGRAAVRSPLAYLLGFGDDDDNGDGDLKSAVHELAAANAATMRARDLSDRAGTPVRTPTPAPATVLRARTYADSARERLRSWQVASFSALAGGAGAERPDHLDPVSGTPSPARETAAGPEGPGMFGFARGARAGTCLHEILEHVDLAEHGAGGGAVRRSLERHGLAAPGRHPAAAGGDAYDPAAAVEAMLARLARAPIPDEGFSLAGAHNVVNEWQFFIPMAEVRPRDIAAVFAAHGGDGVAGRYAGALATLDTSRIHGFLVGFVDAVLSHGERWYVVDWKSNHLGDSFEDYSGARLERTMIDAHYVLQYHLYTLGLHRYLGARLPGYDYDRHFGAALYVFLRGIGEDGDTGWFCDRPPRALVEALDAFFAGTGVGT